MMPLPLTVSCFSKVQIGFTFLVPAHPGSPGQRAVKRVCVCVCLWSELTLSPTLATAHCSCPDNATGLVAQREETVGRKFSRRPGNPAAAGAARWPSAGDTAGYGLRRPKLTPAFFNLDGPHTLWAASNKHDNNDNNKPVPGPILRNFSGCTISKVHV